MAVLITVWAYHNNNADSLKRSDEMRLQALRLLCATATVEATKLRAKGSKFDEEFEAIVVAPEYYFTRQREITNLPLQSRAILEPQKDAIVEKLKEISKKYSKILMIPGTIAFRKSLLRAPAKEKKKSTGAMKEKTRTVKMFGNLLNDQADGGNESFFSNYFGLNRWNPGAKMFVQSIESLAAMRRWQGYDDATIGIEISNLYYLIKNQAYVFLDGDIRFKYNKRFSFHETVGETPYAVYAPDPNKECSTSIGGKKFCLEICFDHAKSVAFKATAAEQAQEKKCADENPSHDIKESNSDFHVVVSDVVAIDEKKLVLKNQGVFIHASTQDSYTCVKKLVNNKLEPVEMIAEGKILEFPVRHYLV